MLIYKTKQTLGRDEHSYIAEIIENNLSLNQKMDLLVSRYRQLKLDPDGFKLLIAGLSRELGLHARFPRKGDVNERYDILFDWVNGYKIVSEVEIPSIAILDAPRNLLDDIAVLASRQKIEPDKLIPLVICWDFPSNRTDYWNVITDINKIVGIKIRTCSILGLAVMAWTKNNFDPSSNDYYLNSNLKSLDNILKIVANHGIDVRAYGGLLAPLK